MSDYIQAVTAENFEQAVVVQSYERPVIVDFWAEWCGPCKQLMPVLQQLVDNLNGTVALATVNTDEQQQLAMQFGIRSLPTLLIFNNGEVVDQSMGVKPESEIMALLKPFIDGNDVVANSGFSENHNIALDYIHNNQIDDAIKQLQGEESAESQTLLLKLYLQERQLDKVTELHATLSDELKEQQEVQLIKNIIDLLSLADGTTNEIIKAAIENVVDRGANTGVASLLNLMSESNDQDEKKSLKNAIIIGFNLIEDKAVVSQLRRKLSSMIFN